MTHMRDGVNRKVGKKKEEKRRGRDEDMKIGQKKGNVDVKRREDETAIYVSKRR